MKTAVAVVLIVCGVVLVAIPPLSDAWRTLMVTRLLEGGAGQVNLTGELSEVYRIGCFALGAAMIGIGVIGSLGPVFRPKSLRPDATAI
ncbi:MAG: hypothetical protein QM754_08275 [Tepidisphaeraceae bacterium]